MKKLPPHMLVKTWLQVLKSNEEGLERQKIRINESIETILGSIELASLYVEQMTEDDIEICFV